jgi:hypothetical protein
VAPPTFDPDVPILLEHGSLMGGSLACHTLDDRGCRENVAELWLEKQAGLSGVGTGYALSEDGL